MSFKKITLSRHLCGRCIAGAPSQAARASHPQSPTKLKQRFQPEVWRAFTTNEGLSSWLAPDVSVDLRKGGDWLVKFPGSTAGGTIVSFVPQKELVLRALAPDRFPHVRTARTHAVFTFTAKGNNTLVRLSQTGWQPGKEWDAAYEYLAAANGQMLAMLHHRYVAGPTDWHK
jgi:uncharacterized protein YndB with AHSA1/START domain